MLHRLPKSAARTPRNKGKQRSMGSPTFLFYSSIQSKQRVVRSPHIGISPRLIPVSRRYEWLRLNGSIIILQAASRSFLYYLPTALSGFGLLLVSSRLLLFSRKNNVWSRIMNNLENVQQEHHRAVTGLVTTAHNCCACFAIQLSKS